jgi:hypothetical protein
MFILLTIFLLIFIPLIMLIIHLVRPKFSIQGFLVVLAVLAGWIMVLIARSAEPQTITLLAWAPVSFFPNSPSLLVDRVSWYFSLALMSLSLSVIITSIAQLGQTLKPGQNQATNGVQGTETRGFSEEGKAPGELASIQEISTSSNWQTWAGMLVLTSFGLISVTAGNMLTLLLAWAALDGIELVILMGQILESRSRERLIVAFTARLAGIGTVLLAGIIPWSQGMSLSFENISQSTSIYLIFAAGLRLGVLPLHLPYVQPLPIRRGLGTLLRLVPAASSYILLVRVADVGVLGAATPYLLGFTALAGVYASINWAKAGDELSGRPYWLLGTSSLAVASAILNQPAACLAWAIASLLSGGLVFSMSLRHKNLLPIAMLGLINLSALPFTAVWLGTGLYRDTGAISRAIPSPFFYTISIAFLLVHAFLFAGFTRHIFRGIYARQVMLGEHIERWVWLLYPLGLIFIIVTHFLIGLWLYPNINNVTFIEWLMGPLAIVLAGIIIYAFWRYPQIFPHRDIPTSVSPLNRFLSFEWLYRLFWRVYRLLTRVSALFSTILEGDGGILWALVLFALIFVFLQR